MRLSRKFIKIWAAAAGRKFLRKLGSPDIFLNPTLSGLASLRRAPRAVPSKESPRFCVRHTLQSSQCTLSFIRPNPMNLYTVRDKARMSPLRHVRRSRTDTHMCAETIYEAQAQPRGTRHAAMRGRRRGRRHCRPLLPCVLPRSRSVVVLQLEVVVRREVGLE